MYDPKTFTYGLELEYSDVLITNELPEGCSWNDKDYTIVNSTGISNDPKGELWLYGGEINTKPTNTIEEQISVVKQINDMLNPKPTINYKSNLHVHIGVPGLIDDVASLKLLLSYIQRYSEEAFEITDPIEKPKEEDFQTEEEYKGAVKRYSRSLKSHHHILPVDRYTEAIRATTFEEFYDAHAPPTKNGNRAWHVTVRPGINLRQLKETGTVEFRHFYGTLDIEEIRSCLIWCKEFINCALNTGDPPSTILEKHKDLKFPKKKPYKHILQKMWRMTTRNHNDEETIKKNIKRVMPNVLFVCTGNINRSIAGEIILSTMKEDLLIGVRSAGLSGNNNSMKPTKKIRTVLENKGYVIPDFVKSEEITKEAIDWCDILFYMEDVHRRKLIKRFGPNKKYTLLSNYKPGIAKIPDPHFHRGIEMHEKVVDDIETCCKNYINSLVGIYEVPKNMSLFG